MRRDRAGHAGAVRMWPLVIGGRFETGSDGAREVRVVRIDLGIDHRDENLVAAREAMRLGQLQFLRRILSAVDGLLLVLRQREEVIGLEARDQRLGDANVAAI
jgi:hypothetical protein